MFEFFRKNPKIPKIVTRRIVKEFLTKYEQDDSKYSDDFIDQLLGVPIFSGGRQNSLNQFKSHEQLVYEGTPYHVIRTALQTMKPKKNDIVYDLGSGYGRFVLYGALTSKAQYYGIEIEKDRVGVSQNISDKLKLSNAHFSSKHILDTDFSNGTLFYMFNPFSERTLKYVQRELNNIAAKKKIKVATFHIELKPEQTPHLNVVRVLDVGEREPLNIYETSI